MDQRFYCQIIFHCIHISYVSCKVNQRVSFWGGGRGEASSQRLSGNPAGSVEFTEYLRNEMHRSPSKYVCKFVPDGRSIKTERGAAQVHAAWKGWRGQSTSGLVKDRHADCNTDGSDHRIKDLLWSCRTLTKIPPSKEDYSFCVGGACRPG